MARIRTIKPEILDDEVVAALPHLEWRLFVSMITMADDYGNLRGVVAKVRAAVLWSSNDDEDATREALARLSRASLIEFYSVRGQSYIHIRGWSKHQKVDHPGKPVVPGKEFAESNGCEAREVSRGSREELALDLDLDQEGTRTGNGSGARDARNKPSRKRPAVSIPAGFAPEDTHRTFARSNALDLDAEVEAFRLHHEAKGSVFASWSAALSTWLRNAVKFRRTGPQGGGMRGGFGGATAGSEVRDLLADLPPDEFNPSPTRKP